MNYFYSLKTNFKKMPLSWGFVRSVLTFPVGEITRDFRGGGMLAP